MNTMCYHPGYHFSEFDNKYQTLIKIKHNREMVGKICPNGKLTPPCTPLSTFLHVAFTVSWKCPIFFILTDFTNTKFHN